MCVYYTMSMPNMSVSSDKLRSIIECLENLESRKEELMEEIRELMTQAKGEGFDVKILRQVLKIRKMKPEDISHQEELLSLYLNALSK